MTAKQALIERVESMTEEEAAELLAQLEWESTEFEELTPAELAEVAEAEAQVARGDTVPLRDALRRLSL